MNFDNYIFDFDGTLANSKQCAIEATKEAFA
ncbi:HAD hydrolase-like protein, partial [Staphylococcus epidermidis]